MDTSTLNHNINICSVLRDNLKAHGIKFTEPNWDHLDDVDPTFEFGNGIHVQVCEYSNKPYVLNYWNEKKGTLKYLGEFGRQDIDQLIKLL